MEYKDQFDIIYLLDSEIGIDSGHQNERPCLVIKVDIDTGEGWVIPITSKHRPYDNYGSQYQLAFGSWIDLTTTPIKITKAQLDYSRLSEYYVDGEDIEELEYRYASWIN